MELKSLNFGRSFGETESTAMRVEHSLKESIVRLELLPGTRLSEQEIANNLGVSRQPVREALISLARSKLVEVRSKRGSYVVKISARDMMEARFVREALETAIVRRACTSFDPFVRASIEAILERQQNACDDDDLIKFRLEDQQFHLALATGSGCPMAWDVIADIKSHIDRVCNLQLRKLDSMAGLLEEHRAIIKAIDSRDPELAVQCMQSHLNGILSDLPKIEADNRELFE